MISIDVISNNRRYNIKLPLHEKELEKQMKELGFSKQDIWFQKVWVENCKSDIEYIDRCINEFEHINIYDLNFLSKYLLKLNEEQRKEYNAILKYEYENVKDIMELTNIFFERNCYVYTDNVKDFSELAIYMIKNNDEMRNLSLADAENILKSLNKTWKGVFDEFNNSYGFVGCISRQKINHRKEINEYRSRDWDGNVTTFKSDIITALGVTIAGQGTLFKGKELLYTTELNNDDLIEVYRNLTGRKPIARISENIYEKFGIMPTHLHNERIKELEIVDEIKEEEEEFE